MGMFDTLKGKCPYCFRDVDVQTKLGDNSCLNVEIGHNFGWGNVDDKLPKTVYLLCKDKCCHCGKKIIAFVEKGIFRGFVINNPTIVETAFGDWKSIKNDGCINILWNGKLGNPLESHKELRLIPIFNEHATSNKDFIHLRGENGEHYYFEIKEAE